MPPQTQLRTNRQLRMTQRFRYRSTQLTPAKSQPSRTEMNIQCHRNPPRQLNQLYHRSALPTQKPAYSSLWLSQLWFGAKAHLPPRLWPYARSSFKTSSEGSKSPLLGTRLGLPPRNLGLAPASTNRNASASGHPTGPTGPLAHSGAVSRC